MANPPIPNIYHLRTVADVSAKSCMICFRPSTSVLITPDNKDFFYVCRGHLKDKGFASPIIDAAAEARKKKEELEREQELAVKEYREKVAAKEKKAKDKAKDKDKEKDKDKDKKTDEDKKETSEENKNEKDKDVDSNDAKSPAPADEELPRVYELHRNFYKMRLDRLQKAEIARRNRELLRDPTSFPAVPKDLP